jgi:hypothetical protein
VKRRKEKDNMEHRKTVVVMLLVLSMLLLFGGFGYSSPTWMSPGKYVFYTTERFADNGTASETSVGNYTWEVLSVTGPNITIEETDKISGLGWKANDTYDVSDRTSFGYADVNMTWYSSVWIPTTVGLGDNVTIGDLNFTVVGLEETLVLGKVRGLWNLSYVGHDDEEEINIRTYYENTTGLFMKLQEEWNMTTEVTSDLFNSTMRAHGFCTADAVDTNIGELLSGSTSTTYALWPPALSAAPITMAPWLLLKRKKQDRHTTRALVAGTLLLVLGFSSFVLPAYAGQLRILDSGVKKEIPPIQGKVNGFAVGGGQIKQLAEKEWLKEAKIQACSGLTDGVRAQGSVTSFIKGEVLCRKDHKTVAIMTFTITWTYRAELNRLYFTCTNAGQAKATGRLSWRVRFCSQEDSWSIAAPTVEWCKSFGKSDEWGTWKKRMKDLFPDPDTTADVRVAKDYKNRKLIGTATFSRKVTFKCTVESKCHVSTIGFENNITVSVDTQASGKLHINVLSEASCKDSETETETPLVPCGGLAVPGDKFGLLAPHIGLVSTILCATVAATFSIKRVKRGKGKR